MIENKRNQWLSFPDCSIISLIDYIIKTGQMRDAQGYAITFDKFISGCVMSKIAEFNHKTVLNSSEKKPYIPIVISNDGLELIEFVSVDCTSAAGEWHSDSEIKIDKLGYVIRNGVKAKESWDYRITFDNKPLRIKIMNICGDESVWEVKV